MELNIFFETKANLKRKQVLLLKDAGNYSIQPGIESLSDEILRLMREGVSGLQNIMLLKFCREVGMGVAWNRIWEFPGEKPEEYERVTKWVPFLHHLPAPTGFGRIHLDRFSPLFELWEAFGLTNVRPNYAYQSLYPLPADVLSDFAYYFDYNYADGRNPEAYTHELAKKLIEWKQAWESSNRPVLGMLDLRDSITIYDTRTCAPDTVQVLSGLEAQLYRESAEIRDYNRILTSFAESGHRAAELEEALGNLLISDCC